MNTVARKPRWFLKGICLVLSLTIVLSALMSAVNRVDANSSAQIDGPFETGWLPPGALDLNANILIEPGQNRFPKLDSSLSAIAEAASISDAGGLEEAEKQQARVYENRVQIQVATTPAGLENAIRAIQLAGGEITGITRKKEYIQAWVPASELIRLSEEKDILYVQKPEEVSLFENLQVGASTTEGLAAMNGLAWHNNGYRGAGIKIAIIDGGFQGYPGLLGSDLPASPTIKNFVDNESNAMVDGTTKHGTACAEIIHDIAPNASLYLIKISTALDLEEAVNWLIDSQNVDVISTSLGWYNLTPGDGTGFFADLVKRANDSGIFWLTAAGNDREAHWGGLFNDPDTDSLHNFQGSEEINTFGPGDGSVYMVPAGYAIRVFLRWNDWANVNQDFSMKLVRWDGSSWFVVASSYNSQNGSAGQAPTEAIAYISSGATTAYGIIIQNSWAQRNVNFDLFVPKFVPMSTRTNDHSLANLADSPAAMTVAALNSSSPYPQESYSSEGPMNGPGGAPTGGAIKPDISAYANVATQSYSGSTFNGTSAATPHVAGAAAVVLSAYSGYTPAQVRSFLEGRAVDMGAGGKDPLFGFGRLNLGNPPPPIPAITVSSITPNSGDNFGGVGVTISGANFISGATPKLTRSGEADITAANIQVVNATTMTCTFNLSGAKAGLWNVAVTAPSSQPGQLTNGFTVNAYTGSIFRLYVPLVQR